MDKNDDYNKIEEGLRQKKRKKKPMKVSGKNVFKLRALIRKKK